MQRLHDRSRWRGRDLGERAYRLLRRRRREPAVAESVADQDLMPAAGLAHGEPVAADRLAGQRPGKTRGPGRAGRRGRPDLHGQHGPFPRYGVQVRPACLAHDGAEADAERPGRGVPIADRSGDVVHARPAVDRHDLDAGLLRRADRTQQQYALVGVLGQVPGRLGDHDGQIGAAALGHAQFGGEALGRAAYGGGGTGGFHPEPDPSVEELPGQRCHRASAHRHHLVTVMLVPCPGVVSMSKSSTSRRAPLRPSPRPPPVV